jgi:hypothetical protein
MQPAGAFPTYRYIAFTAPHVTGSTAETRHSSTTLVMLTAGIRWLQRLQLSITRPSNSP